MAYEDSDYTFHDRYHALSQPYNFGAETHLGGRDMSAFVSPWTPLLERSPRLYRC